MANAEPKMKLVVYFSDINTTIDIDAGNKDVTVRTFIQSPEFGSVVKRLLAREQLEKVDPIVCLVPDEWEKPLGEWISMPGFIMLVPKPPHDTETLSKRITDLQSSNAQIDSQLRKATGDLLIAHEKKENMEKKKKEKKHKSLKKDADFKIYLDQRLGTIEKENAQLRERVDKLQNDNGQLRERVDNLQDDNNQLRMEIKTLRSDMEKLKLFRDTMGYAVLRILLEKARHLIHTKVALHFGAQHEGVPWQVICEWANAHHEQFEADCPPLRVADLSVASFGVGTIQDRANDLLHRAPLDSEVARQAVETSGGDEKGPLLRLYGLLYHSA